VAVLKDELVSAELMAIHLWYPKINSIELNAIAPHFL
jgi:hypothetical protein